MKQKILDILKRALKTFIQGMVVVLPATLSIEQLSDKAFLYSLAISCLMGGVSALMNFILTALKKNL